MKSLTIPFKILHDRGELIHELVRRDLRDRHTGQILGVLWAYGYPLILMLIYTFLFAYVFPARFSSNGSTQDFSVNVLAGIISWLTFQNLLVRAPSILHEHSNLVKQIVFPTEVLPIKTAIASILPYTVGMVFAVIYAYSKGTLSMLSLTLPLLIFCQAIAMVGAAFLLSACGVFLRDIRDIVNVFCTVNLFAQPILYNPYVTPDMLKYIFTVNPFSYIVWCWQDALYYGNIEHPIAWIIFPAGSFIILVIGWAVYEKSKHLFGDVL